MGSVTCVHAAPNSITLGGPLCIMSKNAFTPTAALHWKTTTKDTLDTTNNDNNNNNNNNNNKHKRYSVLAGPKKQLQKAPREKPSLSSKPRGEKHFRRFGWFVSPAPRPTHD